MNSFLAVLGVLGTLLGGGGGLYALLTVRATRRRIVAQAGQIQAQADETVAGAVRVLIGGAADLVEPLKRELGEVRAQLQDARREVLDARREVSVLDRQLHRLTAMIHDPYMTIDRLRVMVSEPGANGSTTGSRLPDPQP